MNNQNYKKIALLLATFLSGTVLATGCGPTTEEPSVDPTKTTIIKLQNYDCGYGRDYLVETAKKFQDAVKDVSYETGKTGVYIDILPTQTNATGNELLTNLPNSNYEVFFTNEIHPALLKNNGYLMDISDIMNATSADNVGRFAEETSIYDRMYPDWQNYYLEDDGSMYGFPLFMQFYNFTYDAELLETKKMYIRKDSTDTKLNFTSDKSQFSTGPDGKTGVIDGVDYSLDDGMPATYDQFYLWCDALSNTAGVLPIHYSGIYQQHVDFALQQLWAEFEGADNVKACWTFDGTEMSDLINVDDNGNVTYLPTTEITTENGYMVQKQEGRYRAMQFAKKLADNSAKWINPYSFSGSESHTEAQGTYISSKYTTEPILMLAEGGYWESEASDAFAKLENRKGGKHDRKFALLPTPKYSRDQVGERSTLLTNTGGSVVVKKSVENAANKQAIIDFLLFFNSEEMMAFENTQCPLSRPFEYEISEETRNSMTNYQKSVYDRTHHANVDVVFAGDRNEFTFANYDQLDYYYYVFYSRYKPNSDITSYLSVKTFKDYSTVTPEAYFNGFYNYFTHKNTANSKSVWESMLNKIQG